MRKTQTAPPSAITSSASSLEGIQRPPAEFHGVRAVVDSTNTSTTHTVRIDPEFQALIPPHAPEELVQLEESLLADGCRDPLVVSQEDWTLLDGHTRLAICQRHGIPCKVVEVELTTREEAKAWIIRNQLGRRNLEPYRRAELALQLEGLIKLHALARRDAGKSIDLQEKFPEGQTRDQVGAIAGVSGKTLDKVRKIIAHGDEALKDAARQGKVSIDAASEISTLTKGKQRKVLSKGKRAVRAAAKGVRAKRRRTGAAVRARSTRSTPASKTQVQVEITGAIEVSLLLPVVDGSSDAIAMEKAREQVKDGAVPSIDIAALLAAAEGAGRLSYKVLREAPANPDFQCATCGHVSPSVPDLHDHMRSCPQKGSRS